MQHGRGLGEVTPITQIRPTNERRQKSDRSAESGGTQHMNRRKLRSPSQHARRYWWNNVAGERSDTCQSWETKAQHQTLNVKISTEAEIVGLSVYLPYNMHVMNFIQEQGYKPKKNVIYQDNMSAIRMEKMDEHIAQ